ncbi:MAG: GNAT family N-acetyltransferase [Phycisphaeraceae bacterium]|nr:GNAT family N-acetyltransferase [Phycisphaeraceae bacterium]
MTTFIGESPPTPLGPGPDAPRVVLVPEHLRLAACARLVADSAREPLAAARRFIETAHDLNIDLSLLWAVLDAGGAHVRQVCLAVIGAGRTAMIFLSGDPPRRRPPADAQALRERAALVHAACAALSGPIPGKTDKGVRLAQALLEPRETAALEALRAAGFTRIGDLAYMRRPPGPMPAAPGHPSAISLPPGFEVRSVAELLANHSHADADRILIDALSESYIDTLDCPELCGLRAVADVLDSHKSVGRFDPALWWVVFADHKPCGCALFSISPEHDSVELVYLGLGPSCRGRGVGSALLDRSLRALGRTLLMSGGVTCAVDKRNTPALRLYAHAGFAQFGVRIPLIRALARE